MTVNMLGYGKNLWLVHGFLEQMEVVVMSNSLNLFSDVQMGDREMRNEVKIL